MGKKISKTRQVITDILREDTGRAMCDSGGEPQYDATGKYIGSQHGFGRSFERNANRDFEKESPCSFDVISFTPKGKTEEVHEVSVRINLYHWLASKLEYAVKLNRQLQSYLSANPDEGYLQLAQSFPVHLREKGQYITDYGGQELVEFTAHYTYNDENSLSQDIQFVFFRIAGAPYVVLQVHNGCDARGGLTRPRIFKVINEDTFFDYNRVDLVATGQSGRLKGAFVYSNFGSSAYELDQSDPLLIAAFGVKPQSRTIDLFDYPVVKEPKGIDLPKGRGKVVISEDEQHIFCPISGWELHPKFL